MKVYFNHDRSYVVFQSERIVEKNLMSKIPGFSSTDCAFTKVLANRTPLVKHMVKVLRKRRMAPLEISPEVQEVLSSTPRLVDIPQDATFVTTPLTHQMIALRYLLTEGSGGLLLDPGLGKTKVILDYHAISKFKRSLVVCPKALLFVWEDEVAIHRPGIRIHVVDSFDYEGNIKSAKERLARAKEEVEVAEGAVLEKIRKKIADLEKDIPKMEKEWKEEKSRIESAELVVTNYNRAVSGMKYFCKFDWDLLAVDEGLIKDPYSLRTDALTRIAEHAKNRVIMSGTLVNNSPFDVYSPARFIEPSSVGGSFSKFKERYGVFFEVKKTPRNEKNLKIFKGYVDTDEIRDLLHSVCLVMRKEDWLKDLPGKKEFVVEVTLPDHQKQLYQDMASNYIAEVQPGMFVEADSPLTVMSKLSQISNGFAYKYEDEGESFLWASDENTKKDKVKRKRETYIFDYHPKAEKLVELAKTTLKGRRFIVWYNMTAERTIIEKYLNENGISYSVIAGGEKDTGGKVRAFNRDQNITILLAQAKAVNYGVTVLGVKEKILEDMDIEVLPNIDTTVYTQVFYSLNYSLEMFIQQQDRTHRIGLSRDAEYYYLLADTPIEQAVLNALRHKQEFYREGMLVDVSKMGFPTDYFS